MKIWELRVDADKFYCLTLVNDQEWNKFANMFDGRKLEASWEPFDVRIIDEKKRKKMGDALYLSPNVPVLNLKALDAINDLIQSYVEILPLYSENGVLYALNVINIIDCIDYENAEFERYPDTGKIMWCKKYAFNKEALEGQHIFKTIDTPRSRALVSDEFRDRVQNKKLKGFEFVEVWSSGE